MIRSTLTRTIALCLALAAAATGQQNEAADFRQRQVKVLNTFAKKVFDKGFPRFAKNIWMRVIKLYDDKNAEAWTALGYVKDGEIWKPDTARPYPSSENTGAGADGQALQKEWEAKQKELANNHRQQAEKWDKAGNKLRANEHWQMVLRWVDKDEQAEKALAAVEDTGVSGTDVEQTVIDRSKAMEKAVEEQSKADYEVKEAPGTPCEPVQQAQIPYVTVTSEHFTLHGDAKELDNLKEALRWAERTLRVCQVAFPWEVKVEKWPSSWAYFVSDDHYKQILKANKVPDLEWKLEHSKTSGIGNTVVGATSNKQLLLDACVRNVAQGWSGLQSDGYREGIGHTFVGTVFKNNRLFAVDLKKQQGTAASEEDREANSIDYDMWKAATIDMAWQLSGGYPANMLPFTDAATFTDQQRLKAWSFTDYLMRRNPHYLRTMDTIAEEMARRRAKQPAEFEQAFTAKHPEVTIEQLEREWANFWQGASPLVRRIQNYTSPLSAASKGSDKWLAAFNDARKALGKAPVNWSANHSVRCKEHAEYLRKNKDLRSPKDLHTQVVDLGGSYHGSLFAQMALVQTGANVGAAKKMFEKWLQLPGYRDALMSNSILSIGIYQDGDVLVINATSGIGTPKASDAGADCYPPRNDTNLIFDGEVPVAELGPEVEALLKAKGREGQKTIGFPLTLHFGGSGGVGVRGSLQCVVQNAKGEPILGEVVYDDGSVRTTSAPGMVTFWPLEPLKGKISFQWAWTGGDKQITLKGAFAAK